MPMRHMPRFMSAKTRRVFGIADVMTGRGDDMLGQLVTGTGKRAQNHKASGDHPHAYNSWMRENFVVNGHK